MANAFNPAENRTVNIDVSASSQSVSLKSAADAVRVMNNGTATAWVEFGPSTVTATLANSIPVGPGVTEVLGASNAANGELWAAVIAAGATGKIYFTPGNGI